MTPEISYAKKKKLKNYVERDRFGEIIICFNVII